MTKIAIDVVLLPPEEIINFCVDINRKAKERGEAKGPLEKEDFIPHISLAMGCMEEKDFDKISKVITEVADQFSPLNLEVSELYVLPSSEKDQTHSFKIKNNEQLQKLHETLTDELQPFLSYQNVTTNMFVGLLEEIPTTFKNDYRKKHSYDKYDPHISLRCRVLEEIKLPINFKASNLAIFHLGISCTCRKLLFSTELKK